MFVDEIEITLEGGSGGDGAVSFQKEKFEPRGGPDGGDGGDGGDVVLKVDEGINTLNHLRYKSKYEAQDGENGAERNKKGRAGKDEIIKVAPGTVVFDRQGRKLADLTEDQEEFVAAQGGKGGRGNARFKSSSRQAPKFSENGESGEKKILKLELKLLADVGLVGFPNVGKSTLISMITSARPKIDNYHFTTVEPNLGVVNYQDYSSYVIADVPGLIEGAHRGEGLGDQFLKHLERTRLLVHMIDASGIEGRQPEEDYHKINNELQRFNQSLAQLNQIIVLNKIDIPRARKNIADLMKKFQSMGLDVYPISAATGEGVEILKKEIGKALEEIEEESAVQEDEFGDSEEVVITPDASDERSEKFIVNRVAPDRFKVEGNFVEKLIDRTDLNDEPSLRRMLSILRNEGLYEELERAGIENGMTVIIGRQEFDYVR
ncbi:GTPase ObgE [Halarsenatibacter silvermanii]|uniref:GTPase Obg n=1 Tax=Halarsenatibacter silvermanii TaxID=321763 RepID=A0A1G9U475_9FIRM|nr:GTPase ObgE [Halarsenatibacter silvermanii]SDM54633.1 GTP-binding protein [Halarsenatibacter silvermanii]